MDTLDKESSPSDLPSSTDSLEPSSLESKGSDGLITNPSELEPPVIQTNASWYALYTRSRFEKKVFSELADRSIEVFLPMREILSRWKDRKKKIWIPLFPGYVFVQHEDKPANRIKVLNIPGAVRFVGLEGRPAVIPEEQIGAVRHFLEADISVDPYPYLHIGRRVEIIAGPLKGVQGRLVQKKGRFRFVLQVDLIRQAVSVEIDASDVRPL